MSDTEIEPTIESMFADVDVAFIHTRNFEAGCFIARIDRPVAAA